MFRLIFGEKKVGKKLKKKQKKKTKNKNDHGEM